MLEKIALLDSHVIRALLVAIVGVIGTALSFFGVNEAVFDAGAARLVDAIMILMTAGGVFYAAYARATKPTPPITESAVDQTRAMVAQQVGSKMQAAAASRPPAQGGTTSLHLLNMISMVVVVAMLGCAALTPAKSFDDRLAYAYGAHTAVLAAAADSVTAHELTSTQGEQVLKLADQSRQVLDAARVAAAAGDVRTAEGQLTLATNILTQLQLYLRRSP